MNRQYPVYTVATECQDCCKCVRQCPVKAIKIENARATVVPELCIACGHCVAVCPAGAKRVRNDVGRVRHLLASGRPVYLSLAPSYPAAFPDLDPPRLIHALRQLGFAGVSETALGAEQVTAATRDELRASDRRLVLSSACPSVVQFVRKYLPELSDAISPLPSPVLAHAAFLQNQFGPDAAVVFAGPCIAKKLESDRHPDCLAVALTYDELQGWLAEEGLDGTRLEPTDADRFVPEPAARGRLFPVEGGMIQAAAGEHWPAAWHGIALAGIAEIDRVLAGLDPKTLPGPAFLELLACPGGCLNGPACRQQGSPLAHWLSILTNATDGPEPPAARPLPVPRIAPVRREAASPGQLRPALARVGKTSPEDELNCGGCGYATCRDFAQALLDGRAEPSMCLSYLRQQAQRKANALLRCMPAGVVVADDRLRVVECNREFARMFGEEAMLAYEAQPGLSGADLAKLLPFADLFATVLRTHEDLHRPGLRCGERILDITVFTVEPGLTTGAVITDVTRTELRREQIAERAREVIQKNLLTVQEVACRLGENMADTEILLRSLAQDYGHHDAAEPDPNAPPDALCNWEKRP